MKIHTKQSSGQRLIYTAIRKVRCQQLCQKTGTKKGRVMNEKMSRKMNGGIHRRIKLTDVRRRAVELPARPRKEWTTAMKVAWCSKYSSRSSKQFTLRVSRFFNSSKEKHQISGHRHTALSLLSPRNHSLVSSLSNTAFRVRNRK